MASFIPSIVLVAMIAWIPFYAWFKFAHVKRHKYHHGRLHF